jgi:hypothetical protein
MRRIGAAPFVAVSGAVLAVALAIIVGLLVGRRSGLQGSLPWTPPPSSPAMLPSSPPSLPGHTPRLNHPSPSSPTPSAIAIAITAKGRILRPGPHPVVAGGEFGGCEKLIRPGYSGDCGVAAMAGGRTIWVSEAKPVVGSAGAANFAYVYTYSPDLGGWVEQLRASDPQARLWSSIDVAAVDLTGDGKPELVFAFHFLGSGSDLGLDIVINADGVPVVVAHPDDAVQGSVVLSDGRITQYLARFPGGAPNCCPPFFLRRTIEYLDGAFRVTAVAKVEPDQVAVSSF